MTSEPADGCVGCSSDMHNVSRNLNDLYTDTDKEIYEIVNYVIITGLISLFGVTTNIINIIVFYKQGFNNTVTISFFGLAISDLCGLIFLIWFSILKNPLFIYSDIFIWPKEILCLTAGMPHICFARITGWITVFITAERCLCIAIPLKIKQIVTPRRTMAIIIYIYLVIMTAFVPEYATSYYGWKFHEPSNRTLFGLFFTSNHYKVDGLAFCVYSNLGSASFVAVIMFTVVLVVQLNRKSKWRLQSGVGQDQCKSISSREKKTMTMVVMIATVLIVCYIPGVIVSMITYAEEEFRVFGRYVNGFFVLWSFVFVFEAVNSSINIFFYYHMSTKYRETFRLIFACFFTDLNISK